MTSISRIGPIPTKNKEFLIQNKKWDQRGNLGLKRLAYLNELLK